MKRSPKNLPYHCQPSDYASQIEWLKSVEAGEINVDNCDWRTRCGVLHRQLFHLQSTHADAQKAIDAAIERCAQIVINFTRIPDDAIRRGTGVRDRIVVEGEKMAELIRKLKDKK